METDSRAPDVVGSISDSSGVTVYGGNLLEGTGAVPAIIDSGGAVYPGDAPGTLTSTGYANLAVPGSTLQVALAGASAGSYSQLVANGADISEVSLDVTSAFAAPYGAIFDILRNTSGRALTGTFDFAGSPLPQGATFTAAGRKYVINYTGGSGYDVTLTDVTNPPPVPSPPVVSAIAPPSGPASGGTSVTITGENLSGAAYVNFGSSTAKSFTVDSSTEITATSPAGTGKVDVTVTTVPQTISKHLTDGISPADTSGAVRAPGTPGVLPWAGSPTNRIIRPPWT